MPNIQQPEMRRSGKDPLVQDSAENKATSTLGGASGDAGPVPKDQQSPYRPQPPRERRAASDREAEQAHGGSMAPGLVDDTGHPIAEPPTADHP
jgi:hypothetical protein